VQGKNYNLHKLQGGGHVPQCPIAGDATEGENTCPGPISTITQNFIPVGVTVAEISVTGQIHTKNYSRNAYISAAFVNNSIINVQT